MPYVEVLAGTLLAIVGCALTGTASRSLSLYRSASTWPTVPGVVVRSELRETTDSDGTSYRVELDCSYAAGGNVYTTSRHTDGLRFSEPEQSARALVSAFPVGKAVAISVDPSNDALGVLITGRPEHQVVIRRVGVVAVLAGICLGVYGILRGP